MAKKQVNTATSSSVPKSVLISKEDLEHISSPLRPFAVRCDSLVLDPHNARRHPSPNIEGIKGSLAVFGQQKPLVVQEDTRTVIAGNGMLQAAIDMGWQYIAAIFVRMDPATAAGFAIADNRTAELSVWGQQELDALMAQVDSSGDERLALMMDELAKEQGVAQEPVKGGWEGLKDVDKNGPVKRCIISLLMYVPELEKMEELLAKTTEAGERPIDTIMRALERLPVVNSGIADRETPQESEEVNGELVEEEPVMEEQ